MHNKETKFKEKIKIFEEKNKNVRKNNSSENLNVGIRISIDLVSTIVVSILIGLGIDKIFSTHPIFFIIFLLLGIIAGLYNIIKQMIKLK
tara:strand:- start:25 stop:294 length:270 start_codon:yes stop_codon:yes gene_type:complete